MTARERKTAAGEQSEETLAAEIGAVAQILVESGGGVALTGAGISVPSGIPDFRSDAGLWSRYDPMEYATIDAFRADPKRVWRMFYELAGTLRAARPNAGHAALAELESMGLLDGVITQNIDNLHQAAGSRNVVELHGGDARLVCLRCDERFPRDTVEATVQPPEPPRCPSCDTILKPDVVLFGEFLPTASLEEATRLARRSRVVLVVGTSALVSPASDIPLVAHQAGATLVEANLERTPLSYLCRHRLVGCATRTLPALVQAVRALARGGATA